MVSFYIFIILDVLIFGAQVVLLHKLRKNFTNKNASLFIGITIARMLPWIMERFTIYSPSHIGAYKNDYFLLSDFELIVSFFSFAIMNVVYFNAKDKQQVKGFQLFKDKIGPIVGIIVLILYSINFLMIPEEIILKNKTKQYQEHVIEFLNEKYGNHNFKVVAADERYEKWSFSYDFYGYNFTVKCDSMKNKFIVKTDKTGWQVLEDDYAPDEK